MSDRLTRAALRLIRQLASLCLVALALVTLVDVIGRYLLNYSIIGSVEITEILMVGVIFSGIAMATLAHEHVTIDLLTWRTGTLVRRVQKTASNLLATGISLLLAAATWSQARSALEFGDQTTMLSLPLAPVIFFMSGMLLVNTLIHAWQTWRVVATKDGHD